jgi:site-specific recombinase XerD
MNAIDWIQQYENYLALVKNRSINTVRGYVADVELLQRFFKLDDWSIFTEDMAVDYISELKTKQSDQSVARNLLLQMPAKFTRRFCC